MGSACRTNVEKRNSYSLLVIQSKGKRPLGKRRCKCKWVDSLGRYSSLADSDHGVFKWVDNIKMDLGEIGWDNMDCIGDTAKRKETTRKTEM
jgi:hypothetical protein